MDKKYWVPALERAHAVLLEVAREPSRFKLTDLCKSLAISKSTLFSLLQTMEELDWLSQNADGTYSLGKHFGYMGNAFFRQYTLIELFAREAQEAMRKIGESFHLAALEGNQVLYLAKETAPSPVQMVSGPGAKVPAHATGLGKALLSGLTQDELMALYPEEELPVLTAHTIRTRGQLLEHLDSIRERGYALDLQEGVMGFQCIAVPVRQANGKFSAAVSVAIPLHLWEQKYEAALQEVQSLAKKLSLHPG